MYRKHLRFKRRHEYGRVSTGWDEYGGMSVKHIDCVQFRVIIHKTRGISVSIVSSMLNISMLSGGRGAFRGCVLCAQHSE